ncbi:MAG: glycosyltransferase [Nanohaloarchaea archaeon]|nr:glycosyltransferase [Candidatus Nanohaloarchaea archaeon]
MRIGFFSDSYFPEIDGVTYTLKSWKEELEKRGHDVTIVYPANPDYEPKENEVPVRSIPNPFYGGYRIPLPQRMKSLPDFDVVHCHGPATVGRMGKFYAKRNDIPTVYTHHTPIEDYFEQNVGSIMAGFLQKLYVPAENHFLKDFDVVTASTEIHRGVEAEKLPVGLDTEFFCPTEDKMFEDLEDPVIGYSGRLSLEKNVGQVIEFTEDFEGTVVIVGEGPQKERLEDLGNGNTVFKDFLPREKLPQFYSSIEAYITASTGDTLGLAPLEANACGTPVLAPDVHPFNETIQNGNGERYEFGDRQDFDQKLRKCLDEKRDTRNAVEEYSLEGAVERLIEIYRSLGIKKKV